MKITFLKEIKKVRFARDIIDNLTDEYKQEKRECFGLVTLTTKNRVISSQIVGIGTLNSCPVHPREVFKIAILDSACSVILVHNHPSGDPEPSPQDREISRKLEEAGNILGIQVLDFLIYGEEGYASFSEKGIIKGA